MIHEGTRRNTKKKREGHGFQESRTVERKGRLSAFLWFRGSSCAFVDQYFSAPDLCDLCGGLFVHYFELSTQPACSVGRDPQVEVTRLGDQLQIRVVESQIVGVQGKADIDLRTWF